MIKNHINNLIFLAKIDEVIEEKELALIHSIAEKAGITREEVAHMIQNPKPFRIQVTDSTDINNRFEQLYNIVQMMLADKRLYEAELKFSIKMAKKLGFKEESVGTLIRTIVEGISGNKTQEEVKQAAQSYF